MQLIQPFTSSYHARRTMGGATGSSWPFSSDTWNPPPYCTLRDRSLVDIPFVWPIDWLRLATMIPVLLIRDIDLVCEMRTCGRSTADTDDEVVVPFRNIPLGVFRLAWRMIVPSVDLELNIECTLRVSTVALLLPRRMKGIASLVLRANLRRLEMYQKAIREMRTTPPTTHPTMGPISGELLLARVGTGAVSPVASLVP